MPLVPNLNRNLNCYRCGKMVDSACGGYWFLLLSPRGRVKFPAAPSRKLDVAEPTSAESVLCAFCGRELREYLESGGYAPGEAYERSRKSNSARLPERSTAEYGGGAGNPELVEASFRDESPRVEGFQQLGDVISECLDQAGPR